MSSTEITPLEQAAWQDALERIRHRLEARRQEIITQLRRHTGEEEPPLQSDAGLPLAGDIEDKAAYFAQYRRSGQIERILLDELEQVEHALLRLHQGNYGYCEHCGRAIDARRLMVRPEATLCISCEQKAEQEQTHR